MAWGNTLTDLSFTFRVDSISRAAGTPGVDFVSIDFAPELLATLAEVVEVARSLSHSGIPVPYIPVRSGPGAAFAIEFIAGDAEAVGVEFEELRVRPTGGIEVHGNAGATALWVRADSSIDEMELVIHATAGRSRRPSQFSTSRRAA